MERVDVRRRLAGAENLAMEARSMVFSGLVRGSGNAGEDLNKLLSLLDGHKVPWSGALDVFAGGSAEGERG